ncbi:hypothetical protein LGK97_09940 [Clostridium sp. CS001]|uniref:alpha/beta hydrolase n=1 Tax=Clostridium sp. CS001 TaxID=2880648 RepID=UPI001CF2C7D3|nr:alpha/beta hydrolase-fold protein [Clostridium sp. CS001]MCB2290088.1 hypothetical protein [Clostridium sp. CS001]
MEKSLLKSKIIVQLEEKIQHGSNEALDEFLCEIEHKGTPLIEKLEGDFENDLVTFVYKADEEVENIVFMPPIGEDNLLENKMERLLETNLWYITYKVPNNIRFTYAFSVNDSMEVNCEKRWDNLMYDKFNENRLVFKGEDGDADELRSYAVMPNEKEHFWVKERNDIPKGTICEHQFQSGNLEESRRIRIYMPYGYEKINEPYGVLVLTDGDEYINILSSIAVLDNLIADKKIPQIVTIFIDSTKTRIKELKCNDNFADIIVKEIIPWARDNYNISRKANECVIGGYSLGGLTAAYLGLKHSEVFGNVLSQSGSYWYKAENCKDDETACWLGNEFKEIDKLPLKFYLNVGVLENKETMIDTHIIFKDILIEKGYKVDFKYFNSGHDFLCWGETLANGLTSLIGVK